MQLKKAIKLYEELKTNCNGLILSGSALRGNQEYVHNLDLIWVGKIFPMYLLPIGMMDGPPEMHGPDILHFTYKGEIVFVYRTDEDKVGAMMLHLTGPDEYNIRLNSIANEKGMTLSKSGLFINGELIASKTEKEITEKLGVKYLTPKERGGEYKSIKL